MAGEHSLFGPVDPAGDAGYDEDRPKRKGFFTDTSICIGCKACEVACKEWNDVPADHFDMLGSSYDNSFSLNANQWRHVAFIEQPRGLGDQETGLRQPPAPPPVELGMPEMGAPVVRPAVDHPVGAGGHAVPAAVAHVLLHDDRAELGAEEGAGRADVEAGRVGAVLADVRLHEPTEPGAAVAVLVPDQRLALLDERDVAPRVRAELGRVVVRLARPDAPVLGDEIPLLARHLARLAADAHRRVGEEAHASLGTHRARRPGWMSHVAALYSPICTLGSSASESRSLAESPRASPFSPQW